MDNQTETSVPVAQFSVRELVMVLWSRRLLLLLAVAFSLAVALGASLAWPRSYEATATVFPVSGTDNSSLASYAGLASLAGISLPVNNGNSPVKTVYALLGSRLFIEKVVSDLDLVHKLGSWGKTDGERLRNLVDSLKGAIRFKEDPRTGVISVSYESSDPLLAQDVTNHALVVLDRLLVEKSLTSSRKKREQLDRQLAEQGAKLSEYQRQMTLFQKETALLNPTAQASRAIDTYTSMVQQRLELELQLATAQASYSADNPRVTLLATQIQNLERQIEVMKNEVGGDLPSIKMAPENMVRYQNLSRDLEIAGKIYASLLATIEQSKLESDNDQVYIEVLDKALVPIIGKPSKSLVFVAVAVLGLFVSMALVVLLPQAKDSGRKLIG